MKLSLQLKDITKCINVVDIATIMVEETMKHVLSFARTIQNGGVSINHF
jgi:hypothetical protein